MTDESLARAVDAAQSILSTAAAEQARALERSLLGDEPIGGASLARIGTVAFVNGCGVRRAFRRRGAQGALLRTRLARARELGCTVGYSATLPGTSSRRNMERYGFRVAYPKIVMLRDA